MNLDREELRKLLQALDVTADEEIDCDEFLARATAVLEHLDAGSALPAGAATVLQHLRVCPECFEEFDALRRALRDDAREELP